MKQNRSHLTQIQDQLLIVKRKLRQSKKITLEVPSDFTFNRAGIKHFDPVLSWFKWDLQNVPVEIDLSKCSSANYQSMTLMLLYCWRLSQQKCTVSITLDGEGEMNGSRVWKMLGGLGLFGVMTDPKLNFKSNPHKPTFAIRNSEDFKLAAAAIDDFTAQFGVEYQQTLRYVLSELMYNVLEHGRSDFFYRGHRYPMPAVVQFTWYEKMNELHFVVADTGVGIKKHLSQAYQGLGTDEEAIRLAVQPEVSGTFGSHDPYSDRNNAGMGLYLSSNIAKKLRGDMYIGSGNGLVHISPLDTTSKELKSSWPGTFVLVTIRLDRGTEIALDSMMTEFRERARDEVQARDQAKRSEGVLVSMYNYFGTRAEVKQEAISYRNKYLLPAVREGKSITLDFRDVSSSTHSFLNALLASPIRILGLKAYKRIRIVNVTNEIRETVEYILDDNTNEMDI
ncbi:TPA: DUF4325 domain-containing protein [Stenotrophomonas maltophilia]|uniref:STAS-like domain-containing protein n=1 Tax=Stenotrophomonas maltophilia TaxID=40324 RepID=UPI001311509B|nr:DUF4325 domain-containing protein [Stenotrophomonas maltophilia]MBA0228364.1 DUF4325 domain-containing protein [Stenotrophomonas maltophilia]